MSVCNFDRLFDMTQKPPLFLASRGGNPQIEQWISSDEDEVFLKFIHHIEKRFLEENRDTSTKVYTEVIDNIVSTYENIVSSGACIDVTSPIYYEIRRLKWKLCLYGNRYSGRERKNVIRDWLRICLNSSRDKNTEFYLEVSEHDREEEIREILFQNEKQLREIFTQDVGPSYLHLILDWSLRRYNLALAAKLALILFKESSRESFWEILKKVFPKQVGNWLIITITIVLLVVLGTNYFSGVFNAFVNAYSLVRVNLSAINLFTTILVLLYPILLIFFIVSFWRRVFLLFKLLIPRLVGGIIVGYLPLILAGESWDMVIQMKVLEGFCVTAFAIGFSLYYIFIEIHNTVKDKWISLGRALRVFSTGLLESFVIGIVVSDLITRAFRPSLVTNIHTVPGLFGYIYPKLLYLYFPLALLIGIFVQIIWEEKPITHPL